MSDRGVARVGIDAAGGLQLGAQITSVFADGATVAVLGDLVQAHGFFPHSPSPHMVSASSSVFAQGIPVCRAGDSASCGHPTTGSANVFVGG